MEREYVIRYRVEGLDQVTAELNAASAAWRQIHAAETAKTSGSGVAESVAGWMAVQQAISLATDAVRAYGQAVEEARNLERKRAEQNLALRDKTRELGNLMDRASPDDVVLGEQATFRMQTGMREDEAIEFLRSYKGAIYDAKQKGFISDQLADQFGVAVARTATRIGIGGKAAAQLASMMAAQSPMGSLEGGMGRVSTVLELLNMAPAEMSGLFPVLTATSSELAKEDSLIGSTEEMAAILSVANSSRMNASAAGTMTRQLYKGLMRILLQRPQVAQQYGLLASDDMLTMLEKIAPAVTGQQGAGAQATLMQEFGVTEERERAALVAFTRNVLPGADGTPSLLRQRLDIARRQGGGAELMERDEQFYESPIGQQRLAEATLSAQEIAMGRTTERVANLRAAAYAQRMKDFDSPTSMAEQNFADLGGLASMLGLRSARQNMIDAQAAAMLNDMAKAKGIPDRLPETGVYQPLGARIQEALAEFLGLSETREQRMGRMAEQVFGSDDEMKQLLKMIESNTAKMATGKPLAISTPPTISDSEPGR